MKEQKFCHITNEFKLSGSFNGKTLSLSLYDYWNSIKYEGRFTNQDNGVIHKKADLRDIYEALFAAKSTDETTMQTNDGNKQNANQTVRSKDSVDCYRIKQDGEIEVYTVLRNELTKVVKTYDSKLKLEMVENMTEEETLDQIDKVQQNQTIKKYEEKIKNIRQEMTAEFEKVKQQLIKSFETEKLNMQEQITNKQKKRE